MSIGLCTKVEGLGWRTDQSSGILALLCSRDGACPPWGGGGAHWVPWLALLKGKGASAPWQKRGSSLRGRPVNTPPPSPPDHPKFLNLSFSNLRFWGKGLAPKAPNFFFFCPAEGVFFFLTLCVYTQNAQNFVESSKMFEKHRKNLTPDLTSGSDLG